MDNGLEESGFRQEIRQWLEANAPASMRTPMDPEELPFFGTRTPVPNPDSRVWLDRAASRGLTLPTVPREYGGGGLSLSEAKILEEEMKRLAVRPPLYGQAESLLAPTLVAFGTDEQKAEHLPAIARGEMRWCQGFSEPGAGSDLASLRLRAVRDGDEYVLDGQKTWVSGAELSDWTFCLVRTDPDAPVRQAGISFLLVDMATPGISTRPIRMISGDTEFSEVFFDGVRVPVSNRVGPEHGGWTVAKFLLTIERGSMTDWTSTVDKVPLVDLWRKASGASGLNAEAVLDSELDEIALQAFITHIQQLESEDAPVNQYASVLKYWAAEHLKRRGELASLVLDQAGLQWGGAADPYIVDRARRWLNSPYYAIVGGTSEIQLNLIAKFQLELPAR